MPWKTVSPKEEKLRFVNLAHSDRYTIVELCEEFDISRKTGHKWIARYSEEGEAGLEERSRAPKSVALRTDAAVERLIVSERRLHPTWGPKKIRAVLEGKHGVGSPPAVSTVGAVLKRNDLVGARRRRGGGFRVQREELTALLEQSAGQLNPAAAEELLGCRAGVFFEPSIEMTVRQAQFSRQLRD